MLSRIKKYPVSLCAVLTVVYLSFFRQPEVNLAEIPDVDKLAHACMYFGLSGALWWEFLRAHRGKRASMRRAWVAAFFCPVLFSGCVELAQEYCTTYRSGEWLDFAANTAGVALASLMACLKSARNRE